MIMLMILMLSGAVGDEDDDDDHHHDHDHDDDYDGNVQLSTQSDQSGNTDYFEPATLQHHCLNDLHRANFLGTKPE